jgi:hypothetical protein
MPPTVFFDPQSYQGYISTHIYNRNRSCEKSAKKYSWSKNLKLDAVSNAESSQNSAPELPAPDNPSQAASDSEQGCYDIMFA